MDGAHLCARIGCACEQTPPVVGMSEAQRKHRVGSHDGVENGREHGRTQICGGDRHHGLREVAEPRGFAGGLEQPCDNRAQRHLAGTTAVRLGQEGHARAAITACADHRSNRLVFEDVSRRQGKARVACGRRESDRHDRVAAEREERVGDADPFDPQDARDHCGQLAFGGRCGRDIVVAVGDLRSRECTFVEFADGRQRKFVEDGDGGGHHVRGQTLFEVFSHRRHIEPGICNHIACERCGHGTTHADHDGRGDVRM